MVEFINQFFIDIENKDPDIRKNAIIKFTKEMLYSLQALEDIKLTEKDEKVHYYAKRALEMFKEKLSEFEGIEKIQPESSKEESFNTQDMDFDLFIDLLKSQSAETKIKAIQKGVLKFDGKLILPYLKEALFKESDSFVSATLVKTIGYLGGKNDVHLLIKYLKDPDPRIRANTIEGLELLKEDEVYKYIIPMLKDKNPRVLANAAKALQKLGKSNVLTLLEKMISLPRREMRDSAIFALSKIKSLKSGKILLNQYLKEDELELISKIEKAVENIIEKGEESLNHLYLEAKNKKKININEKLQKETEMINEIKIEPDINIIKDENGEEVEDKKDNKLEQKNEEEEEEEEVKETVNKPSSSQIETNSESGDQPTVKINLDENDLKELLNKKNENTVKDTPDVPENDNENVIEIDDSDGDVDLSSFTLDSDNTADDSNNKDDDSDNTADDS
ncbi:MAG: HEAT repeat domain-containing protein, partial [Candidatus Muiribacteriota bacterium]